MSVWTNTPPRAAQRWARSLGAAATRPGVRLAVQTIYYLAVLLGLLLIYGKGNFSTPPFIYQGF
jgi:D-Ala-teichoic acid biosynthesis protein